MPHLAHFSEKKAVLRANAAIVALVWGGLAFCAIAAALYDIQRWIGAW